ncbi:MAG: M23 family metallopeptidase, partial [Phycisphaerales bacterium]|nr:M23 family metallopeptidase [Phycisphaerales bacterium]
MAIAAEENRDIRVAPPGTDREPRGLRIQPPEREGPVFRPTDAILLMPLTVFLPPLFAWQSTPAPSAPPKGVPVADGFDFPIGRPDGHGYYDAQPFTVNDHLGEDWNGTGGGNSDLGDPIYSVANGVVTFADDLGGGWGNVVRIVHAYPAEGEIRYVESFYAHLDEIAVFEGDMVRRGSLVGTMGDAHGRYLAHLHFEMRDEIGLPHGPGYSTETDG